MHRVKYQQGSALLTALFIMTLVAIVATAMSTRLQSDIYRTRLIIAHDKLYLASQGVTFWSMAELSGNSKFTRANALGMVAQFPPRYATLYPQIKISGGLYDLQAKYNLNNLLGNKATINFITLIKETTQQANEEIGKKLFLSIQDWLGPYDLAKGKDNYMSYYISQKPPYYPSHQILASFSELRLIMDVSAQQWLKLEPYMTVLPETTPININTATKPVLMSLGNGLTDAHANDLIMARGESGVDKLKDLAPELKKLDIPDDQVTLESAYFLSVAFVSSEDFKLTVYTLLKRSKNKDKKNVATIIRQSFNGF